MTKDEFYQYWCSARALEAFKDGFYASQSLAKKLGYRYESIGSWKYIPLTYELKNMLIGLAGPHRETILKIYQIKHGIDHDK